MADNQRNQDEDLENKTQHEDGFGEDKEKKERAKPRVPSALTVENLKKHEEETDAIDVVELMTKNTGTNDEKKIRQSRNTNLDRTIESHSTGNLEEEPLDYPPEDHPASPIGEKYARKKDEAEKLLSDVWSQPKKQVVKPIPSPAVREEVRGLKFTGEEYLAVSIDVQTDESWIAEMFEWPQTNIDQDLAPTFQSRSTPTTDGTKGYTLDAKRQRKHITSDLSSSEIADEESVLHIERGDDKKKKEHSTVVESDTEDENPVTELTESEFGGSEALTHTTHGTSQTIPSVGPPFILQYKPESQMAQIDYAEIDITMPEDINWDEMTTEQREYYKNIMEDMKRIRKEKMLSASQQNDLINIEPHAAYGSRQERKLAKERERERSRLREMEKQSRQASGAGGQMVANQTNFYAFARQLKTVNYSLSSEKCMEEGWTIRPITPVTPAEEKPAMFVHDPNDDIISGKKYQHMFVRKLYPNGKIFLTVFPDGTGNVWYPSGNVAFSIIASEKVGKLTFIIHEDIEPTEGHNIQAIFEPTGYCTCYYPSGIIRLLLSPFGGEYFSPTGERLKKWTWKDTQTHVHAPPFQPITFGLNRRIGIRIIAQESVYITFSDAMRSVRFNAGTKLRYKPANLLPKIEQIDTDMLLLNEKRFHVQSIIERLNNNLKFPNSPRLKNIQLPSYLSTQLEKTGKLREQFVGYQRSNFPKSKSKKKVSGSKNKSSTTVSSEIESIQVTKQKLPKLRNQFTHRKDYKKNTETMSEIQPVVIVN